MKKFIIHPAFFLSVILMLSPMAAVYASSSPADSVHFCLPFDYEQWRRDHPRPAAKRLTNLNVGEPRTVRMIYFLPNDRPFRQEVVDSMKVAIRRSQTFFAEQMQAHGYGNKIFRFETDAQGEPVVHRVDGQHPNSGYPLDPLYTVLEEIGQVFDLQANIYFLAIDNIGGFTPRGGRTKKNSGIAAMSTNDFHAMYITAHELGHAFGWIHDFRDNAYIMSYAGLELSQSQLSACHAKFLAVHPYFNPDIPIEETPPPTIKLISPPEYSVGSESVSIQLEISDSDGLYQVLLYASYGYSGIVECREVMGEKNTVVTFEYKGFFSVGGFRGLSVSSSCPFQVSAVDMAGNIYSEFFRLSEDVSELPTIMKVSGDDQLAVPGATLAHPLVVEVRDQFGNPLPDAQVTFTVTTGEGKLSGQFSHEQTTTNANGRAESILTLGLNRGANIVEVTIAGRDPVTFNAEGVGMPTAPSEDGDLQKWHLPDGAIMRLGKGILGESSQSVGFSPDGQRLAVASGIGVWLYEVTTSRVLALLPTARRVTSVAFSPDGTMLAAGIERFGGVKLWDVATGTNIATFVENSYKVTSVAFSPDGTMLAAGAISGRVVLSDVATGADIATLEEGATRYTPHVISVSFSSDGTMLAAGGHDGTVKLWDVATRGKVATLSGHGFPVTSVAFSPDGTMLASGSEDDTVKLWNLKIKEHIATLVGNATVY